MNDLACSTLNLPPEQLGNLDNLGYKQMTDIQAAALPPGLAGKDLIAQAKTGSGKTAAFALPLLTKLNPQDFGTQALILCPTRELASQVAGEVRRLARYQQNIKVVVLCGGQSIGPQIGSLEHGAHIVVGTPGRIKDHLRKQTLSLERVSTLVLDEADRMLEMGFIDDISGIIQQTPSTRQTFYICQRKDKLPGLEKLLGHFRPDSAVVFCNTKDSTREVCAKLNRSGIAALVLNGDLEQRDRDQVLVQFRHLSCRVLVATDVAARGLDIDGLPAVINFDMPRDPETYVHRIGRTGRADRNGLALTLFADTERYKLDAICAYQDRELAVEALAALPNNNEVLPEPAFATLAIAAGRKDKVRPGDILGALTGDGGIAGNAVGKIDVMDFAAYVAIDRKSAGQALNRLVNGKIKGRNFKVRKLQGQPR